MHGLGNDFVVVDAVSEPPPSTEFGNLARRVSHRRLGIGGDGLILILPGEKAPFRMRMFNPDGSEAEMCGNGVRCVARFVRERGLTGLDTVPIETGAGLLDLYLALDGDRVTSVRVNMGPARTLRGEIPMQGPPGEEALAFEFEASGRRFVGTAVSMGNPHCVVFVPDADAVPLRSIGPEIEHHALFPQRVNVHFAQVVSPRELIQRTWERGAGATPACGTGACACLAAAFLNGLTDRRATVHLPGGDLEIEMAEDRTVYMTGPAEAVFEGVWEPD